MALKFLQASPKVGLCLHTRVLSMTFPGASYMLNDVAELYLFWLIGYPRQDWQPVAYLSVCKYWHRSCYSRADWKDPGSAAPCLVVLICV